MIGRGPPHHPNSTTERQGSPMEPRGIYIRVSTSEQAADDKVSVPNQLRDCKELSKRKGYHVVDSYIDDHDYIATHGRDKGKTVSPSSRRRDRPEFQRMIADIKSGRLKGLVAWKWDRFGTGSGIYPLMDAIEENPIPIETVTEGEISPLMLSMLTSFRAQALKDMRDRILSAGASRLEQGKPIGGYVRYGYDYDRETDSWSINEEEAKWVRQIFEWYVSGVGVREIRRRLITAGAKQKKGYRKRPWHESLITAILRNSCYFGKILTKWNGQTYATPCPPLVSQRTWQRAQNIMDKNNEWRNRHGALEYLLSGLLKCGSCGNFWHARGARYRYRDGKRFERKTPHRSYSCKIGRNYPDECCYAKSVNANLLEQATWDAITDFLRDGESAKEKIEKRIAELRETREERQAEADRLEAKFNDLQQERQWLILQARKGVISQGDFELQLEMLDVEGTELTLAYQETAADIPDDLDGLWWEAWEQTVKEIKAFKDPDFEGKRKLLESLVDEIVINPELGTLYLHGTLERLVYFSPVNPKVD